MKPQTKGGQSAQKTADTNSGISETKHDYKASLVQRVPTPKQKDIEVTRAPKEKVDPNSQLWVDKYAPRQLSDLIGNEKAIVAIRSWLEDWHAIQTGRLGKKQVLHTREKNRPINDPNARACLISGAPGLGKTTTVRLLAEYLGFDLVEMNASDQRNKKSIEDMLTDLTHTDLGIKAALMKFY